MDSITLPCEHISISKPAPGLNGGLCVMPLMNSNSSKLRNISCSHGQVRARFSTPCAPYTLALDRTQWMLGRAPINFLVLSIVHDGIAFPLFWKVLGKRGNSNTQERIALLQQFLMVIGADKIDSLVAEREFIGAEWFAWLRAHHIAFCIRIRHDMKVARTTGVLSPARNFFRSLPRSTSCCLIGPRLVCGHWLWVAGMHMPCGAYLDRGVESSG